MRVINGNNKYAIFKEDDNSVSNILFAETGTAICTNHDEIRVNPVKELEDYEIINQITVDGDQLNIANLPEVGEPCEAHHFYNWNGQIVLCRQDHVRTNFTPDQTPALFSIYRENTDALQWIVGEQVKVGWFREYNGVRYECIQAHMTVEGQTPDVTPALWNVVQTSNEWTVGVDYKVGDEIYYNGNTYKCLQAHTAQIGWEPDRVPALWQKL